MGMIYEKIYLSDSPKNKCACGLHEIIIEIGKNEYNKKLRNAKAAGKEYFIFPSGERPNKALRCSTDDKYPVADEYFLKEGVNKINRIVKHGGGSKRAIKRLIKAEKQDKKIESEINTYCVYYIHINKASNIYRAIYKYIRDEVVENRAFDGLRYFFEMIVKNRKSFFEDEIIFGSEIMSKPYDSKLLESDSIKPEIKRALQEYDRIRIGDAK